MFQFHKVRLKVIKPQDGDKYVLLFQFHKVRLKVGISAQKSKLYLFQFHKVRLKVHISAPAVYRVPVSIP